MAKDNPEIQLVSNLVIQRADGDVLMLLHNPEDETRRDRWWMPGADLELYEHPDEAANRVLDGLTELEWEAPTLAYVDSFRGRRGWHIVFHYFVRAVGEPTIDTQFAWYSPGELPRTVHGAWEKGVIQRVLEESAA